MRKMNRWLDIEEGCDGKGMRLQVHLLTRLILDCPDHRRRRVYLYLASTSSNLSTSMRSISTVSTSTLVASSWILAARESERAVDVREIGCRRRNAGTSRRRRPVWPPGCLRGMLRRPACGRASHRLVEGVVKVWGKSRHQGFNQRKPMMRMDLSGKKMILNRLVRCKPVAGEMKETLIPT